MADVHTPGPWSLVDEPMCWAHVFAIGKDGHPFVVANCKASMTFVTASDRATDEANARLIAAAPELLEALWALLPLAEDAYHRGELRDMDNAPNDERFGDGWVKIVAAREAVLKAKASSKGPADE